MVIFCTQVGKCPWVGARFNLIGSDPFDVMGRTPPHTELVCTMRLSEATFRGTVSVT